MTKRNANGKIKISQRFNSVPVTGTYVKSDANFYDSTNNKQSSKEMIELIPKIMLTIDSESSENNNSIEANKIASEENSSDNNLGLIRENELCLSLNENLISSKMPSNNMNLPLNDDRSTNASIPPNSMFLSSNYRLRNDSFKQFTERFRSFSIDLFRSIELAHEMSDLRNQKFSTATQTAAAQLYTLNKNKNEQDHLNSTKYGEDLNVIIDENEITSNNSNLFQKLSVDDEIEKTASISSNEKYSLSPLTSHNRLSQKLNSSFDKDLTNINRTSIKAKFFTERNLSPSLEKIEEKDPQGSVQTVKNIDEPDYTIKASANKEIPDDIHISVWEVFIYLWGVITFFADLISDIILSIEYFNSSKFWLGFMTLILVLVPNITLSLFSLSWYIDKYYSAGIIKKNEKVTDYETSAEDIKKTSNQKETNKPTSTCDSITFWITTVLFVIFQIDLIWKYIQGLIYTVKGWACRSLYKNLVWEKYYIEKQIKCDTDIGMLRLIDVFMDSGPQVLLQLYVITTQNLNESGSANLIVFTFRDFKTTSLEFKQFFSILSSLLSMGYALAGYQRCLRNQQFIFCLETNKPLPRPMSWFSTIMQFLWYLFLIAPRVLSMAIFASTFRSWFFMIIFTHWLIMYFWILRLKTNYCITSVENYNAREEIFEKFYDFVCSFIYIFVYFNLKSGATRYRYLIYYIIFYSENLIFSICYFFFSKEINLIYKLSMLLIVIIGFWVAITFQILYYLHCHPSHDIRICVKDSKGCISISKKTLNKRPISNLDDSSVYQLNTENMVTNKRNDSLNDKKVKAEDVIIITSLNSTQDLLNITNLVETNGLLDKNDDITNKIEHKQNLESPDYKSSNKSLFSLSSTSSDVSLANFNHTSSRIIRNKASFSKSASSISLCKSTSKNSDMNKMKGLKSNDSICDFNKSNYEFSFYQNEDYAPLASIKELLMLDDEMTRVNEFLKRKTSSSSKNSK